jgi:zinc-binding in reverse transcriptase
MWLLRRKKILIKDQLLKRGWDGNSFCVFCDKYEDIHHLFVQCLKVKVIWIGLPTLIISLFMVPL